MAKMQRENFRKLVTESLALAWSPEQIAGRQRKAYPDDKTQWISHETIYKWIWTHKLKKTGTWHRRLRTRLKKSRRGWRKEDGRGGCKIKGRVSIEDRPESVHLRCCVGDWEGDTVVGGGQKRIVSFVERKYRFTCLALMDGNSPEALNKAILKRFKDSPELSFRTLTLDNGQEFSHHHELAAKLACKVYFTHPRSPWERGLNENTNGLLRQFYPKGTKFHTLTEEELTNIEHLLNTRPRKCLQYRTPMEAMKMALAH